MAWSKAVAEIQIDDWISDHSELNYRTIDCNWFSQRICYKRRDRNWEIIIQIWALSLFAKWNHLWALPLFIWPLTWLRCFLKMAQSEGSLERIAFILRTSRLCISCSKFEFIQGDLDARTRKRFNHDSMTDFLSRLMNSLYNRVAQNNAHFSRGLLWLLLDDFVLGISTISGIISTWVSRDFFFFSLFPRLLLLFPLAYASGESGERTGGELEGAQVCLELK